MKSKSGATMMSQLHLSDEILMAFADGELEEPTVAAIAKAMAEDPIIAKRIMGFQQSRRLTRSAFSAALMPDVPPELRAAVSAQIKAYETASTTQSEADVKPLWNIRLVRREAFMQTALAASVAAIALVLGYFAGWHGRSEANGLIAQLESPIVRQELNTTASGKDVDLPFGRLRVISTYRLANGSVCREFRLQSSIEKTEAVACRNGEWNTTFALADPVNDAGYLPSAGGDSIAAYLHNIGAGQPLVDDAEAKALAEASR
jgi:hypothetical protein